MSPSFVSQICKYDRTVRSVFLSLSPLRVRTCVLTLTRKKNSLRKITKPILPQRPGISPVENQDGFPNKSQQQQICSPSPAVYSGTPLKEHSQKSSPNNDFFVVDFFLMGMKEAGEQFLVRGSYIYIYAKCKVLEESTVMFNEEDP